MIDDLFERFAGDVLHHVEVMAALVSGIVKLDDVRMTELAEGLDFALEPAQKAGIDGELGGKDLDGGLPASEVFLGEVDAAHAAAADLGRDDPLAEPFAHH